MKRLSKILAALFFAALLVSSGCEETLEICAACGVMSQGDITIAGDPRVDGTLEAVYVLSKRGRAAIATYDSVMSELAAEYEVSLSADGVVSAAEAQAIGQLVRQELLDTVGTNTSLSMVHGRCRVDTEIALSRQEICEDRNDLYVFSDCAETSMGSCTGVCTGTCAAHSGEDAPSSCEGACYVDADSAGDSCLEGCVGTCGETEPTSCAGECRGTCDGLCSSYTSSGACAGYCDGLCDGLCTLGAPFDCQGICHGTCRVAVPNDGACDGTCVADCSAGRCTHESECLGHFRPEGCDTSEETIGITLDCQEVSRLLAWSYLQCEPSTLNLLLEVNHIDDVQTLTAVQRGAQLEDALEKLLRLYGWASVLVDGDSPGEELSSGALQETYAPEEILDPAAGYTIAQLGDFGYVEARGHLPLTGLKARLGMLNVATARGEYEIAAGQLPCVEPAVQEGWAMIEELIPSTPVDDDEEEGVDYFQEDRSAGLYRILDGMSAFMIAVTGGDGG